MSKLKKEEKKIKPCRVQDLAKNLRIMKKERLGMQGRILIYYRGREYEVTGMGHYHFIPDMTLEIRLTKHD
jgi:hypothetical protein